MTNVTLKVPLVTVFVELPFAVLSTKLKVPLAVFDVFENAASTTLPLPWSGLPVTPGIALHNGVPPAVTKLAVVSVGPTAYVPVVRSAPFSRKFENASENRLFDPSTESISRYGFFV